MHYRQLTQEQRYRIYAMNKAGFRQKTIAPEISVHPSTVSRELSRNRGQRGYRAKQAHHKAQKRKLSKGRNRIMPETRKVVETYLSEDQWSPEQISGYLKRKVIGVVSPERIYQHIYADKRAGGSLYLMILASYIGSLRQPDLAHLQKRHSHLAHLFDLPI